jgi:hypothetical protein
VTVPISAGLGVLAITDTAVTKGHIEWTEIAITAATQAPMLPEFAAAATGVKEVGEVVKSGQEVLHAGASALAAGAAVVEARQQGAGEKPQQAQKPQQVFKCKPSNTRSGPCR